MASFNRFSLLQVDDDVEIKEKETISSNKKGNNAKNKSNAGDKANKAGETKKRSRRKKTSGNGDNSQTVEEHQLEEEHRRETLNDISYEEAMKEAILNSQITYEEEQGARKNQTQGVVEEEIPVHQKRKKKSSKKGRHGIPVSLAVLQQADISNGTIKMPAPTPPSPPALPQRSGAMTDLLANNEKEAHRLLEVEKRRETRERNFRNFMVHPEAEESVVENEVVEEEPLDVESLRKLLQDRDREISHLNDTIKSLKLERDELKHYFHICENKSAAQLGAEVDKLARLNRELNNSLVDTCIKLEQERSRAHELEKSLTSTGRTAKTSHRSSESEW